MIVSCSVVLLFWKWINFTTRYTDLYKKYKFLRPDNTTHHRFFAAYNDGTCTKQCIGINTFGKMPCKIAVYLGLQAPEMNTGHCFRRSSATMLANSGSNTTNIKKHGGWKSTSVAQSYIEDSIVNKKKIAENILQKTYKQQTEMDSVVKVQCGTNCTFNLNLYRS